MKTCSHPDCNQEFKDHAWGHIHAHNQGWFEQKNGDVWCPNHIPDWVAKWRAKKLKKG